ncbi:hypothetical protein FLL45_07035 [Aliikangiella marina]|uniref:Signal transduction histidine kinase internal region domain-containing protein n=1 Tax=Aliikangiella marina TaxID=1712262 RepID=A0A545TBY4_9GAMM|nr:histidine kinase [Aliikangiella marina]TQV74709.1 hypothetical protein FLL45_07035 [Aliikangiella marina]
MRIRYFCWSLLAWMCIGLAHAASRYSDILQYKLNVPFSYIDVIGYVSSYCLWALLTLVLLSIIERLRYPFVYRSLTILFVCGLIFWLPLYLALDKIIAIILRGEEMINLVSHVRQSSAALIFFYSLIYGLTFTVCLGVILAKKIRQAERLNAALTKQQAESAMQLSKQKIQLMQSQLSPHLLFNCLGAISALARKGESERLVDAIAKVGNLLRFTILNAPLKTIALFDELNLVDDYLALQRLRFENRFICSIDIGDLDDGIMCPPFTLQPLIENAFKHAVELTEEVIDIQVKVSSSDGRVKLSVINTLPKDCSSKDSTGIGINNLKSRLSHLYQQDYELTINKEKTCFEVSLLFPTTLNNNEIVE